MKKTIFLLIISLTIFLHAKEWDDYITSIETSYGFGGNGDTGFELRGNYDYYTGEKISALLGIGIMHYTYDASGGFDTSIQSIEWSTQFTHLNFYAGSTLYLTDKFSIIGDLYLGMFLLNVQSNYTNLTYSQNYSSNVTEFFFDYGADLGFGYDINEDWLVQLKLFKSFRTIFDPDGFILWLVGSEDAPMRLTLGVKYNF